MIDKICDELFKLKYRTIGDGYELPVINTSGQNLVRETILKVINDYHSDLEAKVYAYEKIISNSNFAPLIETNTPIFKEINKKVDNISNDMSVGFHSMIAKLDIVFDILDEVKKLKENK